MKLIDTHCHLDFEVFNTDYAQVIQAAQKAGVNKFIVPGVTALKWPELLKFAHKHSSIECALGLHPYFIDQHQDKDLTVLRYMLEKDNAIAVGEIGLDYFDKTLNKEKQLYFFEAQIKIAKAFSLPIIVHARKSHDDVIRIVNAVSFDCGGIIHAFNGSLQQAKKLIELGFKLGFGGMLTYEKSSKLRSLAKELPLEAIVLETDAPDMTGASHQGERNSPEYLPEVLKSLAEIRQQPEDFLAEKIYGNSLTILGIRKSD
jgi:TatD DNase family protein